ncbi:MAG TPA: HEAT repeat domain-containing protein [Vicinamibacterales bacterium]|nr:HEAT repeat domain-containing protein [Vicinamibacterales bacterium]
MSTMYGTAVSLMLMIVSPEGAPTLAQRPAATADQISKGQALKSATEGPAALTGSQVALVHAGLTDTDPRVRETAAEVIMARAWMARSKRTAEARAVWLQDRGKLAKSQSRLEQMLKSDRDRKVRLAVVLALSNLEYTGNEDLTISARLTKTLASAYELEQDGTVRNEIIKTLALTNSDEPARDRALSKALSDVSLGAVQQAVAGLARSQNAAALPRIARLLRHHSRSIRLTVAQAMARFGSQAKSYVSEMRAAAAAETDPIVRQTLDMSIALIEKKA